MGPVQEKETTASGQASAEAKAAVDRISAHIATLEAKYEEQEKALREVELVNARLSLTPKDQKDKRREDAQAFFNMVNASHRRPAIDVGPDQLDPLYNPERFRFQHAPAALEVDDEPSVNERPTVRVLERALRDAGLSRTAAKALLANGMKAIEQDQSQSTLLRDAEGAESLAACRQLLATINAGVPINGARAQENHR